jgi:hypothetical protein
VEKRVGMEKEGMERENGEGRKGEGRKGEGRKRGRTRSREIALIVFDMLPLTSDPGPVSSKWSMV